MNAQTERRGAPLGRGTGHADPGAVEAEKVVYLATARAALSNVEERARSLPMLLDVAEREMVRARAQPRLRDEP